jgi:hypothetical protein
VTPPAPEARRIPLGRIALVWLAISALLLLTGSRNILAGQFPDPDDTLRMVQLRDLLAGQAWFDTTQYRIDPPGGVPMHWSRLVDIPLALVALALRPLLGLTGAESAAAIVVPLLTLGCLVGITGWIASRRFDDEVTGLACLACALVPATLAKLQPLRIDHHGWQIVAVMLAVAALFARRRVAGAALAGAALAAGLTISLEVLPFAASFAGVLALAWLRDPAERGRLVAFMGALAAGLVALFAATRGPAALQPWCDAIAPAHLAFFATVAAGCWLLARPSVLPRWAVVAGLGLAGAAGIAAYAAISPQCLSTPFGQLDPLVRHYWYRNVAEGLPVWQQRPGEVLGATLPLAAAGAGLAQLWRGAGAEARRAWGEYLLLFAAAVGAGLLVWRSIAFAGAMAAVPLGWLIARLLVRLRERPARTQAPRRGMALALVALVLVGGAALLAPGALVKAGAVESATPVRESRCELRRHVVRLDRFEPVTLFAPLDIGPTLIERTHHATVATGHHRAQAAMRDVISAFMADERQARAIMARHGAGMVVICTDLVEPQIYAADAPDGLMAQLIAGQPPEWLEPVDIGGPERLKVWRIRN